jgi:hypothetical protein
MQEGDGGAGTKPFTFFTYAIDLVSKYLKTKIFGAPNDEFALILYGTVRTNVCDRSLVCAARV